MDKEKSPPTETTKQFIKKHWPIIAGASTIAGAAVFLTAQYLIKKRRLSDSKTNCLETISIEAITQPNNGNVLLVEGEDLAYAAGREETSQAAQELASETDNQLLADALSTFSLSAKM